MSVRLPVVLGAVLVLLFAAALAAVPTTGAPTPTVTVSPALQTPSRTVDFQGTTYRLHQLGRVHRGEPIDASVVVGPSTRAQVLLIDANRSIVDGDEGTGNTTYHFPTTNRAPGTYVVALVVNGSIRDIVPVVVSKYDVSVTAPDRVDEGGSMRVRATLTQLEPERSLGGVQVVVGSGEERFRTNLSHESGTTYAGTVDTSALAPRSYSLYVVADGTKELANGQNELLGASDVRSFAVERTTTETAAAGGGAAGGGGGGAVAGGGGAVAPATTPAGTASPTPTDVASETPAATTRSVASPEPATTAAGTPGEVASRTPTPENTAVETTASPATATSPTTTTSPGQPLGVFPLLLALAAVVLLGRRRS